MGSKRRMENVQKQLRLPLRAHLWRGKHWAEIQKAESRPGDALRLVQHIRQSVAEFVMRPNPTAAFTRRTAYRIIVRVSELADEMRAAEKAVGRPPRAWNQVYANCMRHCWSLFPSSIRSEIIALSRKKGKNK